MVVSRMCDIATYEKMKDSKERWLGDIPSTWNTRLLKYMFSIKKNIVGETGHQVLSVTQKGIVPKNMTERGQFSLDYSKYQLVEAGDFVMNHMDLLTGWVDISKYNGVTSPDYRVFVNTNPDSFDSKYYKYIFQYCYSNRIFYGLGQGVAGYGRWRLPADMFMNFVLPVPPIDQQRRISCFLDKQCEQIDSIIEESKSSIAEYKKWKKSLISISVTKGIRSNPTLKDSNSPELGLIPKHYNIVSVRWLLSVLTDYTANGSFGDLAKNVVYREQPDYARLVRLTDLRVDFLNDGVFVDEKAYNYLSKSSLYGGEILVANVGAYAGLAVEMPYVDFNATLGPNMFLVKTNADLWDQHFAYYSLIGNYCSQQLILRANNTTAQPKLNKDNFKSIMTVLPPIQEQREIAEYLDSQCEYIDLIIREKEQLLLELEKYKRSIIFETVTGKRKVV